MKIIASGLVILLLCASCAKRRAEKQAEKDEQIIQEYLQNMGLTSSKTDEGLHYIISQQGTGEFPNSISNVTVAYKGYYTDGSVFDESTTSGVTLNLQNVIEGWTIGIPKYREGGNGILLIPSALAYGTSGSGSVPGNTVLIFDVHLIAIP